MALFPAPPSKATPDTRTAPTTTLTATNVEIGLTAEAKQAMISSLQLDITERARRLRQQYNEQAQQLRTRLERRLNRLPPKLRTKTMGELADDYARNAAAKADVTQAEHQKNRRPLKRSSADAFAAIGDDKENMHTGELPPQKKRTKLAQATNIYPGATKTTAPLRSHANVLSPRSHNSRDLSRSPTKHHSPEKARPVSSLVKKPQLNRSAAPKSAPSRAVSRQAVTGMRKPAAIKQHTGAQSDGRDSESSATSAVTTIVKKGTTTKRTAAVRNAPAKQTTSTAAKRRGPNTAKKEEEAVTTSTRTLRSRN